MRLTGFRRFVVPAAVGALCLLLLFALLAAFADRWVNLDAVRARVAAYLSQTLGGTVEFRRIDLSFFPAPRAVLHEVRASVPGKWSGSARALAIRPGIGPVLRGRLLAGQVRLEEPELRADLAALAGAAPGKPLTLRDAREKAAAWLAAMSARAPGLSVEAHKGRVALFRGAEPLAALGEVEARLEMPPDAFRADVRCSWSGGGTLSLKGTVDARTLDGRAEVAATRLDAARLAALLAPGAAIAIDGADASLAASVETAGLRSFRATVRGAAPHLTLRRGVRALTARDVRFRGSLDADEKATEVTLAELSAGSPAFRVAGKIAADAAAQRVRLSLDARDTEVATVRDGLSLLGGDAEPVREIFSRVGGGAIPTLTIAAEGRSFSDPAAIDNLTLAARLRDGTVRVPEAGLHFTAVDADVAVRRGVLSARGIAARLGRSRVLDGTLSLGLSGTDSLFRAALTVDADLPDIPAILARVAGSAPLERELRLVEALEGRASGRLLLGDSIRSLRATVDVSEMRLSARSRRFPFPIRIAGGRFSYGGDRIAVRGLSGSAGRSTFGDVAFVLRTAPPLAIEEASGRHSLSLAELHPWLSSVPGMEAIAREVKAVDGTLEVDVRSLSGPLDRPRDWRYEAQGSITGVSASAARLPGELAVETGRFRIVPEALSLSGVKARLLDASVALSGTLHAPFGDRRRVEASADGSLGPDSVRWLSALLRVPPEFAVRAPIAVAGGRLSWGPDNAVSAAGTMTVAAGPAVSLDLRRREGELDVRDLSVRDDESRAAASLSLTKGAIGLSFTGRLTGGTLNRLFVRERMPRARLVGDLSVYAPRDHPERATARGRLEASGIRLPELLGPLTIETILLEAGGSRVVVRQSTMAWDNTLFTLAGSLESSVAGLRVDMDLGAGTVAWKTVRRTLAAPSGAAGRGRLPPVAGVVRVSAEAFDDGRRTWSPVLADVALAPDATRVSVRRAALCGIEARGEMTIAPTETAVDFQAWAAGSDVGPGLTCLRHERVTMTGRYEFSLRVAGRGTAEALPRALAGSATFRATGGRIYRATLLSKILAVLNLTQIVFGKFPDLAHEGFAYNELVIRGDVKDGKLVLRDALLDAASANLAAEGEYDFLADRLDLIVLASPLKTVDAILRRIPVVGYILGGSLVSVPFGVTGTTDDPAVSVIQPARVGKGILGVVERALKSPVKLIEPILPKEKEPGR